MWPNSTKHHPRILILGGDADGNLGDRAILQSMCGELREIYPDVSITVASSDRRRCERDLGVYVVPRGLRGLPRLCAIAMRSDIVLCGGGGLFQDDDSLVKMPYWGLRVALMRLLCPRVIGYSLGVGPLRASSSRLFARLAFACMDRVSVRDPEAQRIAQALTRKTVHLVPDPALLLRPASKQAARGWLRENGIPLDGPPLLGVAARRWLPSKPRIIPYRIASQWRRLSGHLSSESERLTSLLAHVLDRMVAEHNAYVIFLPTYNLPHEGDDRICEEILRKMTIPTGQVLHLNDPALYMAVTAELRTLLGGRMHPTIFAASVGIPVVGLAYNQKFYGFFELLGLRESVLDVNAFVHGEQVEDLVRLLDAAFRNKVNLLDRIPQLAEQVCTFNRSLMDKTA